MSKPHECPVCGGSGGRVEQGGDGIRRQRCHPCNGTGIVWEVETVSVPSCWLEVVPNPGTSWITVSTPDDGVRWYGTDGAELQLSDT